MSLRIGNSTIKCFLKQASCFEIAKHQLHGSFGTDNPRINPAAKRALRGLIRTYLLMALALFISSNLYFLIGCPLNVRVGENSPKRCPTMFSVTNTVRCLRHCELQTYVQPYQE